MSFWVEQIQKFTQKWALVEKPYIESYYLSSE